MDIDSQAPAASAIEHGIRRVIDDVEINLLQLVRISHYKRQYRLKIPFHRDVVDFQVVVAQRDGVFQHAAQVNVYPLRFVLPREGEQVLHDPLGALRLLTQLDDEFFHTRVELFAFQQLRIAQNGGERIVQLVRHSRNE